MTNLMTGSRSDIKLEDGDSLLSIFKPELREVRKKPDIKKSTNPKDILNKLKKR